jgi:hypothetical protein
VSVESSESKATVSKASPVAEAAAIVGEAADENDDAGVGSLDEEWWRNSADDASGGAVDHGGEDDEEGADTCVSNVRFNAPVVLSNLRRKPT